MANSNKVFVSPGVYTSEKDLTFVAQSVGVTTLGLAGETLKGPAFEPVLITDFDEFKTYFGTTSPEKYGNGNPKYELAYVAKAYLQESNQLFVTRVLGLTGFKPNKTFGIKTIAGISWDSTETPVSTSGTLVPTVTGITGSTFYGALSGKTASTGDSVTDFILDGVTYSDNDWFTIGVVPEAATAAETGTQLDSPLGEYTNQNWYNNFYTTSGGNVNGLYSYLFHYSGASSTFVVTRYNYTGTTSNDYGDITVAALRPRGGYTLESLGLEVTSNSAFVISSDTLTTNPLGEFTINVTGSTSGVKEFTCSLDTTSSKYITKVIGLDVFDKKRDEIPVYVHEVYPTLIKTLYEQGLILGLSLDEVYHTVGNDFVGEWDTPASPMVVSEVRGGKVSDLFQVFTVSDGNAANYQVKITLLNIDLDTGEFDILVRDFNDSDDNMVVLEKFTRCTMDSSLPGYVGRKVGTQDGEYELRSKYIMLVMADEHPEDAIPAGFKGFVADNLASSTSVLGAVKYKTQFFEAGDETGSFSLTGEPTLSAQGDKPKKVSLGLSSQIGFDSDLLKYKGVAPDAVTVGFHLSTNASAITGNTITGKAFDCTPYDLEGSNKGKLDTISFRKFTFAVCGGFDGWDIYRSSRTNGDGYVFGKRTYVSGHTTNSGVFSTTVGNSDYYAYLKGIETYSNPEAVDINIFATPGINFDDHNSLVTQTIDIIENDRADSLYIINSPNVSTADEITEVLDGANLDSNYSATYWPWIQVRDNDNSTQLYLPPTGEVVRNIALTDNVSYPWFAVAGYSRGLVNSIKAFKKLTLDERDSLYKARINPIATFSDTGTIIWGNKTLQVRESALDRINVRRLLLRARKLISAVAVRLLFEQNDEQVRQEFLRLVNPILESIKKERGLYDFRVTVSSDPEDIDANTLRGKIYIKPTRSLEFIDVEFIITPTGASFENI
jgi:hypothetical protein